MRAGMCHRPSDSTMIREALEGRGRQSHSDWTVKRRVDFVIFVVNAFSVYSMREAHDVGGLKNLAMLYKKSLSFIQRYSLSFMCALKGETCVSVAKHATLFLILCR